VTEAVVGRARGGRAARRLDREIADRRIAMAMGAAGLGTWFLDPVNGTAFNDDTCLRIYGLEHVGNAGVTAEMFFSLLHPDDVDRYLEQRRRLDEDVSRSHHILQYRIVRRDGTVVWVSDVGTIVRDDRGRPISKTGFTRDVTAEVTAELERQRLATHDVTTGLLNIGSFIDGCDRRSATIAADALSLIVLRLDRLTQVSEVFGPEAQTAVIVEAGRRLTALAPKGLVARVGAAEFVLAVHGHDGDVAALAASVLDEVRRPFLLSDGTAEIHAACGVATAVDGVGAAITLERALAALARAKRNGTIESFDPAALARRDARRRVGGELRRAVAEHQLRLFVQPELDLGTGRLIGGEALVRWQHPERGLLPPAEFVPHAEDLGLSTLLDRWVLSEGARLGSLLRRELDPTFVIRVNLSALHLSDPALVRAVRDALGAAGLAPEGLCVEVTETAMLDDAQAAVAGAGRLRDLGVGLALDDFGTGYSSLSNLRMLPVDAVKIDRSFVMGLEHEPADAAIVAAVARLAKALGRHVTAEGVENHEQLRLVRLLGCDSAQGYLFARPMPVDEFIRWSRTEALAWTTAELGAPRTAGLDGSSTLMV
jgi:PAS domain S-box-containing protein